MSVPQPFQWEYDRAGAEAMLRQCASTFSIGVFQWLPKASGKGLKRSTTIRVNGYKAEPRKAFERAEALCAELNAAKVRLDQPPDWLQKQYSVPKPAGFVKSRRWEGLTGPQARAIREQVMREELLPLGYVKAEGGTYVRRRGEQIHLIDFQPDRGGGSFTVNLGFHCAFVPPMLQRRPVPLNEVGLLDCLLRARIGSFLPDGRDTWFNYGADRNKLREVFLQCAAESLLILDRHAQTGADPERLLSAIKSGHTGPWHGQYRDPGVGYLRIGLGHPQDAQATFEQWLASAESPKWRGFYQSMLDTLAREARALDSQSNDGRVNWIVG